MKQLFLILTFLLIADVLPAHPSSPPSWFTQAFNAKGLNSIYNITPFLKPAFLQGDFNGDKVSDFAILITEKKTKKKGVLLMHGKSNQFFVFGAGKSFGSGSTDFNWLDQWSVYKKNWYMKRNLTKRII